MTKDPVPTRKAYGAALVELGEQHEEVVALDADLAVSTQSMKFGKKFPERFFNVGAAEANMMSMSCGLAVIFAGGVFWLAAFVHARGLSSALAEGFYPFIAADFVKLLLAAAVMPSVWWLTRGHEK